MSVKRYLVKIPPLVGGIVHRKSLPSWKWGTRRLRREISRTNAEKCGFLPLSSSRRGIKGIGKLSDLVGWHGQTLFVRAFLATRNGTKSTGNVEGNCPPLAGDQGGGKGTRKQCGKNQKPMKPIITPTINGCDRFQTTCVRK